MKEILAFFLFFTFITRIFPRFHGRGDHPQRFNNCSVINQEPCTGGQSKFCIIGPHGNDHSYYYGLLQNWKYGFAFVRYADGEYSLIKGEKIGKDSQAYRIDKFWSDGGVSQIGIDLKESLRGHYGERYAYAFVSPSTIDDSSGLKWYLQNTEQRCEYISYSNLWINAYYLSTKQMLEKMLLINNTRSVIIANYNGLSRLKQLGKLDRMLTMELPDEVNTVWKGEHRGWLIGNATKLARSVSRHYFFVSGGPMAKVLISYMWKANRNNAYLDFGSSMDEILKGVRTRPYMDPTSKLAKQTDPTWYIGDNGSIHLFPHKYY